MSVHRNSRLDQSGAGLLYRGPPPSAEPGVIWLPPPQMNGGKALMRALTLRQSSREFSSRKLAPGVLSNLLWAAYGVNRPDSGGRTAPSAHDCEEIEVYVATADGLARYDAGKHALRHLLAQDIRARTGLESYVGSAPVELVYVADSSRLAAASDRKHARYTRPDAGFIAQNVYLFCASEGLATVVRDWVDRPALAKLMKLAADQHVILAQSVGYPARSA